MPGRPSSQNWIKSKTIYHLLMNFDAFLHVFLILLNFGWMVDLAMSIFEFFTKFLIFWHPWHPWVCIRSDLKPLETDISDSSFCVTFILKIFITLFSIFQSGAWNSATLYVFRLEPGWVCMIEFQFANQFDNVPFRLSLHLHFLTNWKLTWLESRGT